MTTALYAHAFWVQAPGNGQILRTPLVEPREGEVLVQTLFSGISRGTESLVYKGNVPASQHQIMRAPFQEGNFPGPVKYGYSNVGLVLKGPASLLNRAVFCLFPHQDFYVVPEESVVPIPANVPKGRAILAANMETAINGLWDSPVAIGSDVIVVGAGVIGCLAAYLVNQIPGTRVLMVDIDPCKKNVTSALGVKFSEAKNASGSGDMVIHASGSQEGLHLALELAGKEATILELSWFGKQTVKLPLGEGFHSKRLRLQSSQVGQVGITQRSRWDYRRRLSLALDLLADDILDQLISGHSEFEQLPETMRRITLPTNQELCHCVTYSGVVAQYDDHV